MCGTARVVRDCSGSEEEEEKEEQEEEEEEQEEEELQRRFRRKIFLPAGSGTAQPTSYNPTPPRIGDQQILGDH